MGAQAARIAIEKAQLNLRDLDAIISACGVGEQAIPCTAALIQQQLGLESSGIACFDVNSTCLSFITALDIASHLLAGGRYKRILIVSSEIASHGLNWQDMETCTIFGDGAAACVVEKSEGRERILSAHHETHSIGANICKIDAGGTRLPHPTTEQSLFYMEGKKVFKLASKLLDSLMDKAYKEKQLNVITLRPRAIFGPYDRAIFPRLLQSERQGVLPIIGNGQNLIDITYVENVVESLILAAKADTQFCGNKYNITNGEPQTLMQILKQLFDALQKPLKPKFISYTLAKNYAACLEKIYRLPLIHSEPRLTKYSAGILSLGQTLNIDAAQNDLGYQPLFSISQGIERFAKWYQHHD